ncbi:MAG: TIGR04013 family B12-binding domain/radical SAM domain-containing protein [Candidatus Lokiarchaeota archaeon]|nr:TIGR04013 family B12-binding domain/radical SAM domain-containing protein [Candidatus Lokiarchaeota archaeon]
MSKNIAFIAYYHKKNIFSLNAVIAAIETNEKIRDINLYYVRNDQELFQKLPLILANNKLVIIGFSIFTKQFWDISNIVRNLRSMYGNQIFLIAGGSHPSGDPEGTLKIGFDVIFLGESERSIIEFLLSMKKNESTQDIQGIAYYDEEKIIHINKKKYSIDLNQYPPFPLKNTKYGSIEITRGCPYMCYFCQTSFMMGNKVRYRSIDTICRYIKIMKDENLTDIRFITPNAFSYGSIDGRTVNYSKLEELLSNVRSIIGAEGRIFYGSFPSEVRPEHVNNKNLSIVKKYANNDNIVIGAQSGSQDVLDYCNRAHNIDDIYQAVRNTINMGFKAYVDFIFGLPHETDNDREKTMETMKNLIDIGAKINAHTFTPLPQTPFYRKKISKIDEKTKKFLNDYNFKGKVFGNWREQEKLSIRIRNELNI